MPITRARPVCGNRALSKSDHPGARFSTMEMARAKARGSPERRAEIRAESLAFKRVQCKALGGETHTFDGHKRRITEFNTCHRISECHRDVTSNLLLVVWWWFDQ